MSLTELVREYQEASKTNDDARFSAACVALLDYKLPPVAAPADKPRTSYIELACGCVHDAQQCRAVPPHSVAAPAVEGETPGDLERVAAALSAAWNELWATYGDGSASGARITTLYDQIIMAQAIVAEHRRAAPPLASGSAPAARPAVEPMPKLQAGDDVLYVDVWYSVNSPDAWSNADENINAVKRNGRMFWRREG